MATTVDRAMAKAAAALLPGLLPTPPRSTMIAPCLLVIPPVSVASKINPSRADSAEKWDARKNDKKRPSSPASSNGSSSSWSTGRASSCDRWDSKKSSGSTPSSSCGSSKNPGRADSVERWNAHKISPGSSTSSSNRGSSKIPDRASSCVKWDSSSKRPPSRASSADRWDAHKRPRSAQQTDAGNDEGRTGEQEINETPKDETMEMDVTVARADHVFSGPSFFVSPEPSMLPVPAFFASPEPAMLPVPAFLMAH